MGLIDADAVLRHKRKMSGADFGGEFWDEAVLASDIKNAPTVDAVPVSELEKLRDYLYAEDLIFMRGLAELNKLISTYERRREKKGVSSWSGTKSLRQSTEKAH